MYLNPSPILPLPTPPSTGNHTFLLSICESVSALLYVFICFYFCFLISNLSKNILSFSVWLISLSTIPSHPSMLLQMAKFHSFLWRNNIPLCMYINTHTYRIFFWSVQFSGIKYIYLVVLDPQAPLALGFSRQEYYSGEPIPSPRDLPDPETEPRSPAQQADSLLAEPLGKPPEPFHHLKLQLCTQETINKSSLPPSPQVLATTILPSASMNLTVYSKSQPSFYIPVYHRLPSHQGRWIGKKLVQGKGDFMHESSNILTMIRSQTFLTSTHRLTWESGKDLMWSPPVEDDFK